MPAHDLPRAPPALADHAARFTAALDTPEGHAASGLTPAQFADLDAEITALRDALRAQREAEVAYRAATAAVRTAHRTTEVRYRALRRQAGNHVAMTDVLRKAAGLTVRDRAPGDAAWVLTGSATATRFVHEGAEAGAPRHYRVEACRGARRGLPSNVATV